jgi:hypothetical protein
MLLISAGAAGEGMGILIANAERDHNGDARQGLSPDGSGGHPVPIPLGRTSLRTLEEGRSRL